MNERTENIGARRLYTVMEKLLEDISYDAGNITGEYIVDAGPSRTASLRWPHAKTWHATSVIPHF